MESEKVDECVCCAEKNKTNRKKQVSDRGNYFAMERNLGGLSAGSHSKKVYTSDTKKVNQGDTILKIFNCTVK